MFSNSNKAVLVNSSSLKSEVSPAGDFKLGSGWVSLPERKSEQKVTDAPRGISHASKSFVGSVHRDADGDEEMQPGAGCEKKEETPPGQFVRSMVRGVMVAKGVVLPCKFYGPSVSVSYASGVAASKQSWNPLAVGEFATFADLFSEYKVKRIVVTVWFTTSAEKFIIGGDPGGVVTGTPTDAISNLSGSQRWNTLQTHKSAPIFGSDASKAPVAPKSSGGFVSIVTPWTGQTCMLATTASGGSTSECYQYQTCYELEFRCRY